MLVAVFFFCLLHSDMRLGVMFIVFLAALVMGFFSEVLHIFFMILFEVAEIIM